MRRVFIYGSCVTRDAEPWFQEYGLEMVGYVARQSLISAFRPAKVEEYNLSRIESPFQRRMTKGDIEGNLRFQIQKDEPDLIVWDLCDERLGVKKAKTGGVVTHIRDHVAEGIHPGPFGPIIKFGSDDHFALWRNGLGQLMSSVERYGLGGRIVLNATPWAVVNDAGEDLGDVPRQFNDSAERYVSEAESAGVSVARIPEDVVIARTDHQWGPAPFHYVDSTYREQLDRITALV